VPARDNSSDNRLGRARDKGESEATPRHCMTCGRESLTDCCLKCEPLIPAAARGTPASQVESAVRGPLGTSTRDSTWDGKSSWDGDVLREDDLAAWDDHPTFVSFINEIAGNVAAGFPPAYRYAAVVSGEERKLSKPEFVQWKRRGLLDSGAVPRPPVLLPALPDELSVHAHRVWPQIELLLQVRVLGGTPARDPLPLTRRFLRRWVPMREGQVRTAMEELEAREFVMKAGTYPTKGTRPMNLWVVRLLDPDASVLPPAGELGADRG
jgi:hypothetical protein